MKSVEITAHRGSSAKAPENTLAAMRQAIADGCHYIEIDVQTSADGAVVVVHDRDLLRVADDRRRVEDLTLPDLKQVDVGRRFSTRFIGEQIPTLAEVIEVVQDKVRLNIELKLNRPDPQLVPAVLEILRARHFLDRCVITSLDATAVRSFKIAEPTAKIGLIVKNANGGFTEEGIDLLSITARRATPAFIQRARCAGKQVHVWTINEPEAMRRFIESGVDNIITDKPDVLRAIIEECRRPTSATSMELGDLP